MSQTIRILLVDDEEPAYILTRALLSKVDPEHYELEWASTYEEALQAFEGGEYDLYLIDYMLGDRSGLDLLGEAANRRVRAPLIMLTGKGSREVDLAAGEGGAWDYLVKGEIDPDRLERSIRYAVERRRAEDALRESEARHRSMFDHLPIGLYRSKPDGEFVDANPALSRMLGYPDADTLHGRYAASFYVSDEDRDRFLDHLHRDGVVRGFESTLRRTDGSEIRVRNTARLHRTTDGEILYLEGALEDVTELHQAEDVMEREARFSCLFAISSSGVAVLDLDGRILQVNPSFARIAGVDRDEVRGRPFSELMLEEDRDATERSLLRLAERAAQRQEAERRLLSEGGGYLWARTILQLVTTPGGGPDVILAVLEDVSEAVEPIVG